MRSALRSSLFTAASLAIMLAGCGPEVEVPATLQATAGEGDPSSRYGFRAVDNLQVVPVELEIAGLPRGWEGMRIAALSDFQLGLWPQNEAVASAAVQRAVSLRPDLVVLLGDYIARGEDFAALQRVVAPLRGRPTFAVLGDADKIDDPTNARVDSTALRTIQALRANGITVLINERGRFTRGGETAYIAGLEPYIARRPDWRRAEIFGGIPTAGVTPLVLSHMPAITAALPDRFPAVLAGHSTCGPLEVPGTPRLLWLNTEVYPGATQPLTERLRRIDGTTLFVTCGVGFSFVPARFGGAAEVALVTLRGVGAPAAGDTVRGVNRDSLLNVYRVRQDSARRVIEQRQRRQAAQDSAGT